MKNLEKPWETLKSEKQRENLEKPWKSAKNSQNLENNLEIEEKVKFFNGIFIKFTQTLHINFYLNFLIYLIPKLTPK